MTLERRNGDSDDRDSDQLEGPAALERLEDVAADRADPNPGSDGVLFGVGSAGVSPDYLDSSTRQGRATWRRSAASAWPARPRSRSCFGNWRSPVTIDTPEIGPKRGHKSADADPCAVAAVIGTVDHSYFSSSHAWPVPSRATTGRRAKMTAYRRIDELPAESHPIGAVHPRDLRHRQALPTRLSSSGGEGPTW